MTVGVTNAQRTLPVDPVAVARVARCAIRALRIRTRGRLEIAFLNPQRMRAVNRRFCRHHDTTDVLSFRYEDGVVGRGAARIVGEILVAPSQARAYAARHHLAYTEELFRYVIHGLLHWLGHDDRTAPQRHRMRALEDHLLAQCLSARTMQQQLNNSWNVERRALRVGSLSSERSTRN